MALVFGEEQRQLADKNFRLSNWKQQQMIFKSHLVAES